MIDDELTYLGVLISDLVIEDIDWTGREDHIRYRSIRLDNPLEFDVEPEWATEAALDPLRLARQRDSGSLELVGFSPSARDRGDGVAGRILRVWLIPVGGDPRSTCWLGRSACIAPAAIRARYQREK